MCQPPAGVVVVVAVSVVLDFQRAGIEYINSSAGKQVWISIKAGTSGCIIDIAYSYIAVFIRQGRRAVQMVMHISLPANTKTTPQPSTNTIQNTKYEIRDTFHASRYTRLRRAHLRRYSQKSCSKSVNFCQFLVKSGTFLVISCHFL